MDLVSGNDLMYIAFGSENPMQGKVDSVMMEDYREHDAVFVRTVN